MDICVFGCGPMPCEPGLPVMAPGARTWQIARTAAAALATRPGNHRVTVFALEPAARDMAAPSATHRSPDPACAAVEIVVIPQAYEDFVQVPGWKRFGHLALTAPETGGPAPFDAVIGCASVQPCATAAGFAEVRGLPLWIDFFGDPLAEVQTKAELHPDARDANDELTLHVWRLVMKALLRGDRFSALSARQRFAVMGQLGPAGRLNRHTRGEALVHDIPYALFPDEISPPKPEPAPGTAATDRVTVLWSGSFNTWMDVDSLVEGMARACGLAPNLRFKVMGGRIAGYNDVSYGKFTEGIRRAAVADRVELIDWVPLEQARHAAVECDFGFSIDRFTYEAVLGSRTRLVNFLAAGTPVISTPVTELASTLAAADVLIPFRVNDPDDLAHALKRAADLGPAGAREMGRRGQRVLAERFDAAKVGVPLSDWLLHPAGAKDRAAGSSTAVDSPLSLHWQRAGYA